MPNYIPYIFLIIISIVLFVVSWKKAADKKLIILYLCMVGFIYYFEFTILVVFKSYKYMPGVFRDPYLDNIFGANVSDGFIVPAATIFIAAFDLSIGWIVLIILCFVGIEELFLYLQVYKHFWWKTIFTGLSLPIQFALGNWVWHFIRFHPKHKIVQFVLLYFANVIICATFLYYLSAIFEVIYYRVHWFHDPTRGHIAFQSLYAFIASIFSTLVIAAKANHLWKTIWIFLVSGFDVMTYKWGILEVTGYWTIALLIFSHIGYLLILLYFQKVLDRFS